MSVAREHRLHLETRGLAYGDPVLAMEVLQNRLGDAEEAARQLECRRSVFLAAQAKVEVIGTSTTKYTHKSNDLNAFIRGWLEGCALRVRFWPGGR